MIFAVVYVGFHFLPFVRAFRIRAVTGTRVFFEIDRFIFVFHPARVVLGRDNHTHVAVMANRLILEGSYIPMPKRESNLLAFVFALNVGA